MKYFFFLVFWMWACQLNAQLQKTSDTIFKNKTGDYLAVNDKNLITNQPIELWAKYGERIYFSKDIFILENPKTRKFGVIDISNKKVVLPFLYEKIWNKSDSVLTLRNNNLLGLYFPKSNILVNAENYKVDYCLTNGNYFTLRNDSFQIYDKTKKLIFQKDSINNFVQNHRQNLIEIQKSEKVGLVDINGKLVLYPKFKSITILDNGNFILPNEKDGYGIYSRKDLKKLSKISFYGFEGFKGLTVGFGNNTMLFYNDDGDILSAIKCTNKYITRNQDDDFLFEQNSLWGIVSYNGKIKKEPFLKEFEIIPHKMYFKGRIKDKWEYFNYKGNSLGSEIPIMRSQTDSRPSN